MTFETNVNCAAPGMAIVRRCRKVHILFTGAECGPESAIRALDDIRFRI